MRGLMRRFCRRLTVFFLGYEVCWGLMFCTFRKFFPPTEQDLSRKSQAAEEDEGKMLADMPDPPTTEPLDEGQPEAKKQKVASENQEDEWEVVEKPEGSTSTEDEAIQGDSAEKGTATGEEQSKTEKIESEEGSKPTGGGNVHAQNILLKDW